MAGSGPIRGKTACTPQEAFQALLDAGGNKSKAARLLGVSRNAFGYALEKVDQELLVQNIRLAKQKQALQDLQRVERKSFREHARVENAVEALGREIVSLLRDHKFTTPHKQPSNPGKAAGIVHWSDQHLNERVELPHNIYDWEEAGRRLKKHVDTCRRIGKAYDINSILVAFTGDLLNSDRRLDELAANAGNRAKACVLAADLYRQAIIDLAQDFDVTVAGISGNESRIPKDVGWNPDVASDNYDFTIVEMLRLLLSGQGINFVAPQDPSHQIIAIGNQNVLLLHGHGAVTKSVDDSIQTLMGLYSANGVKVHMAFWGHIHSANIGDYAARSGGMVGSNDYNEKALGIPGRASQNFYIVHETGGFDGVKIDLQNTEGVKGYCIQKSLEAYNTKSANKTRQTEVIHQVVI